MSINLAETQRPIGEPRNSVSRRTMTPTARRILLAMRDEGLRIVQGASQDGSWNSNYFGADRPIRGCRFSWMAFKSVCKSEWVIAKPTNNSRVRVFEISRIGLDALDSSALATAA